MYLHWYFGEDAQIYERGAEEDVRAKHEPRELRGRHRTTTLMFPSPWSAIGFNGKSPRGPQRVNNEQSIARTEGAEFEDGGEEREARRRYHKRRRVPIRARPVNRAHQVPTMFNLQTPAFHDPPFSDLL